MAAGIGASGILGVAFETVPNTYVAPTKFIPFISENIKYHQDTKWRRPVRNSASLIGAISGNSHIEGEIIIESLTDCIIYFLYAARTSVVKTGTGPYNYVCTQSSQAMPTPLRTLSITIVRNGVVFGYTGCTVGSFKLNVDNGELKFTATIVGRDEATQGIPTPTWPTSSPFGPGQYSVQVPTATQVFDTDTFEFDVADNATAQFRLKSTGTSAQFVIFGENVVHMTMTRDFDSRAEFDNYKALTSQSITLQAIKSASESVTILAPVALKETYETAIGGEAAIVHATVAYQVMVDNTGKTYQITLITPTENVI